MSQPLFGIVPAGLPVLTSPSETPSPTSCIYTIASSSSSSPDTKPSFSHVVVFLLPGVQLPPGTAAAIYLVTPPTSPGQTDPSSRFLGGIGPGKESAIFKIEIAGSAAGSATILLLGISVEDAASVASRIEEVRADRPSLPLSSSSSSPSSSSSLVPPFSSSSSTSSSSSSSSSPSTLLLAQRIGQNAFNFLASYSARIPGSASSEEVIPMRAFAEWWRKFESRVRNDATFLERPTD